MSRACPATKLYMLCVLGVGLNSSIGFSKGKAITLIQGRKA